MFILVKLTSLKQKKSEEKSSDHDWLNPLFFYATNLKKANKLIPKTLSLHPDGQVGFFTS